MEKKSSKSLKIIVAVMAVVILVLGGILIWSLTRDGEDNSSSESSAVQTTLATEAATEATTETVVTTTEHVSPIETVSFSMGSEKSDINEILDYDGNKTYKANMSDFVRPGDKVDSFVFVFYAEDGSSNISSYKGACGISVDESCPAATDKCWYQSDDFEMSVNSAYLEVKWDVPSEIKDYVNTTDTGSIEIGYWWGGLQKLRLASIICNYSTTAEIPVDGTKTIDVNKSLSYGSESDKTVKLPLSDMIPADGIPQYFEFNVEGGAELQKYSGAFGISVDDSCPDKTDKGWYQSGNIAVMTSSNSATLYWLVPEEIKEYIKSDGEVMLGYWWSNNDTVNLKNVTVKYSSASSGTADVQADADADVPETDSSSAGEKTSAEIVKDMKIGWNLGNTLDCYDYTDYASDGETAWGNPKTTKAMIDTVKAAGFNAVRIPVSWTDHLNGDTIDEAWLSRVNEVVDYVIDNGMYAIINVHHDDYTWLNPTKADEAAVKAKFVKIWEQIASRFKNYDEHLLFEGMNEPRVIGGQDEWSCGTAEEREVINNLFAAFIDTVRKSGGNNSTRTLVITCHAAAMDETAIKSINIPDDKHIIVSIHAYSPYSFALDQSGTSTFSDADKAELDKNFDLIKSELIDKGVPAIIGEFGSLNKDNTADRVKHMEYYVKAAKERGITCFIWDNGVKDGEGAFGLLDRKNLTWYFKEIVDAAMNGIK
ncbi:MAG: cellulase family glycosylhydrolase [Porcipelethomonas sp.]